MTKEKYENIVTKYPDEIPEPFDGIYKLAGFKALYHLANEFGGSTIYIPKTKAIFRDCLINAIKEEYNGRNVKELARKYDYSVNGIKNILR